jgi:hypothetical protein
VVEASITRCALLPAESARIVSPFGLVAWDTYRACAEAIDKSSRPYEHLFHLKRAAWLAKVCLGAWATCQVTAGTWPAWREAQRQSAQLTTLRERRKSS